VEAIISWLTEFLLFVLGVFMILLILIQRGKGGGLAGAFGGMGGQSAFGTKAGDLFTRITIGVAAVWIVLCIFSVKWFSATGELISQPKASVTEEEEEETGGQPSQSSPQSGSEESSQPAKPAAP
jgi:preprotein translocase subunit SecG